MTNKPKSKGRVVYWEARTIGRTENNGWFARADTEDERISLAKEIEAWNSNSQNNNVELVRVEVTPV